MAPCLSLQIILRIPVRIINDHCVCSSEIESKTSRTSTQQKHKAFIRACLARTGEAINRCLTIDTRDSSIKTLSWVSSEIEVIFKDVQNANHLREDQDFVSFSSQLRE